MNKFLREWADEEKRKLNMEKFDDSKVRRKYLHFDKKFTLQEATLFVSNPRYIAIHRFKPFLRYYEKVRRFKYRNDPIKRTKLRPISFASHKDAYIYSWYGSLLKQKYEDELKRLGISQSVLAYRTIRDGSHPKSNIDFANEIFEKIKSRGPCVALTFDVKGFFDNLKHSKLKAQWLNLLPNQKELPVDHYKVFCSLTRFHYVVYEDALKALQLNKISLLRKNQICDDEAFKEKIVKTGLVKKSSIGIPQGSAMSGILSNIYMLPFDRELSKKADEKNAHYRRYSDDIIIVCHSTDAAFFEELVAKEIGKLGLNLQTDKTDRVLFQWAGDKKNLIPSNTKKGKTVFYPLQYLGFEFDGSIARLRSATIARYIRKMKSGVKGQQKGKKWNQSRAIENGKNPPSPSLNKKKLYRKYSHLGHQNLFSYMKKAHGILGLMSGIAKQRGILWNRLNAEIQQAENELKPPVHKNK